MRRPRVVDFQHHFTPRELFKEDLGSRRILQYDETELPAERIVFATDYPQEIRAREAVRDFVTEVRGLGAAGERILSGNVGLLWREHAAAATA